MDEEKTKKKNNLFKIILPIIILVVLVGAGIGGYFVYQIIQYNKPIETAWGQKYFEYIEANTDQGNRTFPKEVLDGSMSFIQLEDNSDPIMIARYTVPNSEEKRLTMCFPNSNGNITSTAWVNTKEQGELGEIKLLYNIEQKQYKWYYITEDSEGRKNCQDVLNQVKVGQKASELIEENIDVTSNEEYKKLEDERLKKMYDFDKNVTNQKTFEETFIEPEGVETKKISFNSFINLKELKNNMREATSEYKSNNEIVTAEAKENVEKKVAEYEEEQKRIAEEAARKAEAMKITQSNVIEKVGEHLKYFAGCYLGRTYGIGTIYKLTDVTGKVNVPGTHPEYEMSYEVVGLSSISSLNDLFKKYISDDVVSRLKNSGSGNITADLHDYNGKVYWVRGGIGDGPEINYKKAKVLSSEGDTSTIQLDNIDVLGNILTERITVTVKYDEATSTYKITNYSVKNMY